MIRAKADLAKTEMARSPTGKARRVMVRMGLGKAQEMSGVRQTSHPRNASRPNYALNRLRASAAKVSFVGTRIQRRRRVRQLRLFR